MGKPNIKEMRQRGDVKGLVKMLMGVVRAIPAEPRGESSVSMVPLASVLGGLVGGFTVWMDEEQRRSQKRGEANLRERLLQWVSEVIAAIAELGQPAVEPLIKELRIDAPAVELLLSALGDKKKHVRARAALSLGEIGDKRAVEVLMSRLRDKEKLVRAACATALGTMKTEQAIDKLVAVLEDKDEKPRIEAALALGNMRNKRAVMPLVKALNDKKTDVREAVANALSKLAADEAIEPLIKALKDREPQVRVLLLPLWILLV